MKKLFVMSLAFVIFLITGCGSEKVLKCTMSESLSGNDLEQVVNATFEGDGLKKIYLSTELKIGEEYMSKKSAFVSQFKSQFSKFDDINGVDSKVEETDEGVKFTLDALVSTMDDDALNKLGFGTDLSGTYDEAKERLEKGGYTCK